MIDKRLKSLISSRAVNVGKWVNKDIEDQTILAFIDENISEHGDKDNPKTTRRRSPR